MTEPSTISAEYAISRVRRDLTLGALLRFALLGSALLCVLVGPFTPAALHSTAALFVIGAVWLVLSFRSAQGSRESAIFPSLIAAGQYDAAERQLQKSLATFSLFKSVKVISLHHLAMLRHAQNRYQESAMLCRALLGQRLGPLDHLSKTSRLILADDLLELNDLSGAYQAIARLYHYRLSLGEALRLLWVEQDYLSRIGAWDAMMANIPTKVELAELMPTTQSARTQALLALAAKKVGRKDWSDWLRRRVELLLGDVKGLISQRPMLAELWN
jgi:hypothetical protein